MIKAVFFDVDGTLLDTTEYIYGAFEHSLAKYGHKVHLREYMRSTMGKPLEECYRAFTELEDVLNLMKSHHQFQLDNPALAKPYPHTQETLASLKAKEFHIGAITSRRSNTVADTLKAAGIMDYIDRFLTADDVTKCKPDPEGIFTLLTYFSVSPRETMMVGDTNVDVEAGRNAGTITVGATYGFHGERIIETKPDHVIHDIKEIVDIVT